MFNRKKRRDSPLVRSVHTTLSKRQRAYSVFLPAPYDSFPLFQAISVLPNQADRSNSPRSTPVNLKTIFERLRNNPHIYRGYDQAVIDAFINEFNKTALEQPQLPPEYHAVSQESLSSAGVEFSSHPGPHLGISSSHTRTTSRQIRLQHHFSQSYNGGSQLHTLIWTHAQAVLQEFLKELHGNGNYPSAPGERALLAIVTKRILSTVGVSKTAETVTSAGVSAGDGTGTFKARAGRETRTSTQEDYQDLYGVTGLRFIVFPIECTEEGKWRIYRGISVCDSDMNDDDDSFTQDTRNRDSFYRAQKWVFGEAELMHGSDSTTLHRSHTAQMSIFGPSTESASFFGRNTNNEDNIDVQGSLPFVEVSHRNVSAPWIEVEISPGLKEFAQKQCTLASYFSKTVLDDSQKLTDSLHLLRRGLRNQCFESTVRAIYDLSRCYRHGVGINLDFGVAKVLRYCANGLRRNYDSRSTWLRRLALEVAYYPNFPVQRRIVSLTFFARRTLTSLILNVDQLRRGGSITGVHWDSDRSKTGDHASISDIKRALRGIEGFVDETDLSSGKEPQERMLRAMKTLEVPFVARRTFDEERDSPAFKDNSQQSNLESRFCQDIVNILSSLGFADVGKSAILNSPTSSMRQSLSAFSKWLGNAAQIHPIKDLNRTAEKAMGLHQSEERIVIVISYKHARQSMEGLPQDLARVQKAVRQAARQLSQNRPIFSCDFTPKELRFQLHGRLKRYEEGHGVIKSFLDRMEDLSETPWLAPIWNRVWAHCLEGLRSPVQGVASLKNVRHHVWRAINGSMRMREVCIGKLVTNPDIRYDGRLLCLTVAQDREQVISGGSDRTLHTTTLQEERSLHGQPDCVNRVAISRDGRFVCGSSDCTIRAWDVPTDLLALLWEVHNESQAAIIAGKFEQKLASLESGYIEFLRLHDSVYRCAVMETSGVTCDAVNDDGSRTASGSEDNTIRVCDDISIPLRHLLKERGITAFVDGADITPGTEAASAMANAMETAKVAVIVLSPEFMARKWPMRELMCFLRRREECMAEGREAPAIIPFFYGLKIEELCNGPGLGRTDISPEFVAGKWSIIAREVMCLLRRCEECMAEGREAPVIIPFFYRLKIEELYSGPGFGRTDKVGNLLHTTNGGSTCGQECCGPFWGHDPGITGVDFHSGDEQIVSRSIDGTMRIWDVRIRGFGKQVDQHDDLVTDIALTPDRFRAVFASSDKTIRIWDAKSGRENRTFLTPVSSVAQQPIGWTCHGICRGAHHAMAGCLDQTAVWVVSSVESADVLPGKDKAIM